VIRALNDTPLAHEPLLAKFPNRPYSFHNGRVASTAAAPMPTRDFRLKAGAWLFSQLAHNDVLVGALARSIRLPRAHDIARTIIESLYVAGSAVDPKTMAIAQRYVEGERYRSTS
jgi:hypothetical protein